MNKITGILMLLIYICVATAMLTDNFVSAFNMQNLAQRTALFGVLGIGVAFVIITAGIDLSIGSVVGLIGCLLPLFLIAMEKQPASATVALTLLYLGLELAIVFAVWLATIAFNESLRQGLLYCLVPCYGVYFWISRWRSCRRPVAAFTAGVVLLIAGLVLPEFPFPRWAGIGLVVIWVMAIALQLGLIHGLLITKVRLQPFVVTLCGLLIYRGLARRFTGDQTQGFGTGYTSLRWLATGKPCSVALVIMLAGVLIGIWFLVRLLVSLRKPAGQRQLGLDGFGVVYCFGLAVVGSSRFWHGFEFDPATWQTQVAESGAALPGELMWWMGLLFIPAAVWFLAQALRSDWRKILFPLASIVAAALLLGSAIWVINRADEWFWFERPSALAAERQLVAGADTTSRAAKMEHDQAVKKWAMRCRMVAAFSSLGVFLAGLAWFGRVGLKVGGNAARLPLIVAASTAVLWLAGKSNLARAHVPENLHWLLGKTSLTETLVPMPFFALAILGILAAVFLNLTIYGRYLLAVGRNEEAARYSGIKTDRMVIAAYIICSGAAGFGAILFALDGNSIQPSGHGNFYELYAIAAAVLGGCSLRGGEGSILGVVIGAAVMQVLYNSINLLGIPSDSEYAIIGIVILLGVIVDELVRRVAARRRAVSESKFAEAELG